MTDHLVSVTNITNASQELDDKTLEMRSVICITQVSHVQNLNPYYFSSVLLELCDNGFSRLCLFAQFYLDIGIKRKEQIKSGSELYDSALFSA